MRPGSNFTRRDGRLGQTGKHFVSELSHGRNWFGCGAKLHFGGRTRRGGGGNAGLERGGHCVEIGMNVGHRGGRPKRAGRTSTPTAEITARLRLPSGRLDVLGAARTGGQMLQHPLEKQSTGAALLTRLCFSAGDGRAHLCAGSCDQRRGCVLWLSLAQVGMSLVSVLEFVVQREAEVRVHAPAATAVRGCVGLGRQ